MIKKLTICAAFLTLASGIFAEGKVEATSTTAANSATTIVRNGNAVTELHSVVVSFTSTVTNSALLYLNDSVSTNLIASSGTLTNSTAVMGFNFPIYLKDGDVLRLTNSYTGAQAKIRYSLTEK